MTSAVAPRAPATSRSVARIAFAALILATVVSIVGPAAHPEPVAAGTAEYMEGLLVQWINDARVSRGLPALRVGWRLRDLAGDRAADMAAKGQLFHVSCLSCLLRSGGVSFSYCAEVIAYTSYPWGYDAAKAIYNGWRNSSGHWGILMSKTYTRFGIGVAYRSQSRTTYAAGLFVR